MISAIDIGRLAGLLDADGCFGAVLKINSRRKTRDPYVHFGSVDKDSAEFVAGAFGCGVLGPYTPPSRPNRSPFYEVRARGSRAVGIMMTVYSLVSDRRKHKIKSIIDEWKLNPVKSEWHLKEIWKHNHGAKDV